MTPLLDPQFTRQHMRILESRSMSFVDRATPEREGE